MRLLRIRRVMQLTGLSRITIYRLEITGQFPKRRQLIGNLGGVVGAGHRDLGERAGLVGLKVIEERPMTTPSGPMAFPVTSRSIGEMRTLA
jgi:hypothetical protein